MAYDYKQGTPISNPQQDYAKEQAKIEAAKTKKQKCEDAGGTWDEKTQTCILISKPAPQQTETQQPTPNALETFTSSETGRASGITTPDGRTFLGLSPDDVQKIATGEQKRAARPEGTQPVGTAKAEALQQQQLQQSLSQLGNVDPATLELQKIQQADIDWGQAITAGTMGNIGGIAKTAATSFAVGFGGSGFNPIVGGAVGVIGAAASIWGGMQANIKEQQQGEIGATTADLAAGQLKMRQYAMAATRDPYHADRYIQLYNNEKAKLYISQRQLQTETTGNLNKWMDDGRVQQAKYEDFLETGGISDVYEDKIRIAIISGVPLLSEDLE